MMLHTRVFVTPCGRRTVAFDVRDLPKDYFHNGCTYPISTKLDCFATAPAIEQVGCACTHRLLQFRRLQHAE